jgi:hypothetical protein
MTASRFGLSFFRRAQHRLRDAFECRSCGKSTRVFNAGETMTFRAEMIRPETHCTCPGGIVDLTRNWGYFGSDERGARRHARFSMVHSDAQSITIRDEGPWTYHPTITNDPEWVVAAMLSLVGKRRLYYVDSDGRLDELLIKKGRFAGFAPGPLDPVEVARLTRC